MSSSKVTIKTKENNLLLILAATLIIFVVLVMVFKKLFKVLNTESPVLDETSKKILNDKQLIEKYYEAIENEKTGGKSEITVEGENYKIIRAGKYHQPVTID